MGKKKKRSLKSNKPIIYWVLMEDQLSNFMVDFLKFMKENITEVSLQFLVLSSDHDTAKMASVLSPLKFQLIFQQSEPSLQNFMEKRDAVGELRYSEELELWRVLLLDDLAGPTIVRPLLSVPLNDRIKAIVIQIPSAVGSTPVVERTFHAFSLLGHKNGIPVIGLEFFPLNTPWTLAPLLMDGAITIRRSSYEHLANTAKKHYQDLWLLPKYEASLLFLDCSPFWRNAMTVAQNYQKKLKIPSKRTILYIPHNVAMIHEYHKLLKMLSDLNEDFHIMFAIGFDQARGTYTHREIVENVYAEELARLGSYSFHDLNEVVDMALADAVITLCPSGSTSFSSSYGIPTIIADNRITAGNFGSEIYVQSYEKLEELVKEIVQNHGKTRRLEEILTELAKRETGYLRENVSLK